MPKSRIPGGRAFPHQLYLEKSEGRVLVDWPHALLGWHLRPVWPGVWNPRFGLVEKSPWRQEEGGTLAGEGIRVWKATSECPLCCVSGRNSEAACSRLNCILQKTCWSPKSRHLRCEVVIVVVITVDPWTEEVAGGGRSTDFPLKICV